MLIDLHSHLLPNIDDGSKSLRASIRMAKEAVDNIFFVDYDADSLNSRFN